MNGKPGVLAVMDEDRIDAIPKREAFQGGKYLAALNAKSLEARATVQEMAHHAERLLAYIDSAHGDQFRELIEQCAAPGSVYIDGLRAALAAFRGEV